MYSLGVLQALALAFPFLPYSTAAPAPASISTRDEVHADVIRIMQCGGLYKLTDKGGWEQGMGGHWPDAGSTGPPDDFAIFDLKSAVEDEFYNPSGASNDYTNKTSKGFDFSASILSAGQVVPENGIYVGKAKMANAAGTFQYNCQTDNTFEYTDPDYRKCQSYLKCEQKDSLKLVFLASEEVEKKQNMPPPEDVYGKIDEVWTSDAQMCDQGKDVDLGVGGCKLKFKCQDDDGRVFPLLKEQFLKLKTDPRLHKVEEIVSPMHNPTCPGCSTGNPQPQTWRSYPKWTKMAARAIPSTDNEFGMEVAFIETQIVCEGDKFQDALCNIMGTIFGIGEMIPAASKIASVAGTAIEAGCALFPVDG